MLCSLLLCFSIIPSTKTCFAEQAGVIYIRADGSIDPPTAPIATVDNITYTLTQNATLNDYIEIERNNIIFDGAGYTIINMQFYPMAVFWLQRVSNVTVRSSNFVNSGPILLGSTSDCVVENNNFTNCDPCFGFYYSTNTTLSQNVMKNSTFGYLIGNLTNQYMHSIDTSNTIDGKPVYYLKNQQNLTINLSLFPEIGFLALINSTNILIENLSLSNCFTAVQLAFTNNSVITHNIIKNNVFGILASSSSNNIFSFNELVGGFNTVAPLEFFFSSCNNTVTGNWVEGAAGGIGFEEQCDYNTVSNNSVSGHETGIWLRSFCSHNLFTGNVIKNCGGEGIYLDQSQNNTFIENTIMNTTRALRLEQVETYNNTFYHNNFGNNTQPFLILGTIGSNIWDNGLEGNFWSAYNGTDNNQDGIGDKPYIIDENNTDHYPLMGTFQSFNVSITPQSFGEVDVISNFTISNLGLYEWLSTPNQYLQAGQPFLRLIPVQEQNMTAGFCRMTLPNNILNTSEYIVLINMTPVIVNKLAISNDTHTTLYFTFNSSALDGIIIVLEFPSFLVLPLFMTITLLAIAVNKRRHMTRAL